MADGCTPAKPVVGKGRRLAGRGRIGDADQPVVGIPAIAARSVRGQVAVGVVGEGLPGEVGELIDGIVGRRLRAGRRIGRGGVAGLGDAGNLVFRRRVEGEVGILAGCQAGVAD
ncbi:hypothetical protein [Pleomorphomonas sp. PLEO]|uniref:hypothetical protein n=1 Tax=Pleomorphomonas sp. PLEO TaxID=3239306 RepID=UPI00351E4DAE